MSNLRHDNALWHKTRGLKKAVALLAQGQAVVMATVETRDGTPWRLLMSGPGRFFDGTEGGLLEARVASLAAELEAGGAECGLWEGEPLGPLGGDAAAVYGGITRLCLDRLAPEAAVVGPLTALARALADGRCGTLVTRLSGTGPDRHVAVLADAPPVGPALPAPVLAEAGRLGHQGGGWTVVAGADGTRYLCDPHTPLPPVVFAGAGQVSRLAAPLAAAAGFRTVILDDDPAFANRERFPEAEVVRVVPGFVDCFADMVVDAEASVVIVTRGHAFDGVVLAQALRTGTGYVGMMGCKSDGRARIESLARLGFAPEVLARVRTPIGLPLGGQTPFEIALSIVAECVEARSARRRLRRL